MKNFKSIKSKLITSTMTIIVLIFLSVLSAIVLMNINTLNKSIEKSVRTIRQSIIAKGNTLAINNSMALRGMVEDNAFTAIQALVSATITDDEDIIYGIYMNTENVPFVFANSSNLSGTPKDNNQLQDTATLWASQLQEVGNKTHNTYGDEVIEFAAPVVVEDEVFGYIRYGISTQSMRKALTEAVKDGKNARNQMLIILLFIGATALIISYLIIKNIANRITLPINNLASSTRIIAEGNYDTVVQATSSDEIGDLAERFEAMRGTIKKYTDHLQDLVDEKMQQVNDILNNIDQGLFTINLDGTINEEYSLRANEILKVDDVARCTVGELLRLDLKQEDAFQKWIELVKSKYQYSRWKKLTKLAPVQDLELWSQQKAEDGVQYVSIQYNQIFDKQKNLSKIMILAKDETETRIKARQMEAQRHQHENEVKMILGITNTPPEEISEFMDDTDSRLKRLKSNVTIHLRGVRSQRDSYPGGVVYEIKKEDLDSIYRDLHTIKGNAGSYGFDMLTMYAHRAEDFLEKLRQPVESRRDELLVSIGEHLDLCEKEMAAIHDKIKLIFGKDEDITIRVPETRIKKILDLSTDIVKGQNENALVDLLQECKMLSWKPLKTLTRKYNKIIQKAARQLQKNAEFIVENELEMLPMESLQDLDDVLVHICRNAVDHGIEAPEVREETGKGIGRIRFKFEDDGTNRIITISDDGRGIECDAIVNKAISMGVIRSDASTQMSINDKLNLIFHAGLSTAEVVSDISGRGVGMDVVKSKLDELGGSITINSLPGKGTSLCIKVKSQIVEASL